MHSRRSRTRAFPVNWQPRYDAYTITTAFIIPPVTDVHVMLRKSNAKEEFCRQNVAKERLSVI